MIAGCGLMIFRLRLAVTTAIQELQVPNCNCCQGHDGMRCDDYVCSNSSLVARLLRDSTL